MAFAQPFGSQEQALERSVFFYGLVGIIRTGGMEAAVVAQKGREQLFIASDQSKRQWFHTD